MGLASTARTPRSTACPVEGGPARVRDQILGADEHLVLERRDARALLVADLQLLQVPDPIVGDRGVTQVMLDVSQHQRGAVH